MRLEEKVMFYKPRCGERKTGVTREAQVKPALAVGPEHRELLKLQTLYSKVPDRLRL